MNFDAGDLNKCLHSQSTAAAIKFALKDVRPSSHGLNLIVDSTGKVKVKCNVQ